MTASLDPLIYLKKALQLDSGHKASACAFAKFLIEQGEWKQAVEFINDFMMETDGFTELYNHLAMAYLGQKMISEAEDSIMKALAKEPRSKDTLFTAFRIKKSKGDKYAALYYIERIIRYDQACSDTFIEMASLLNEPSELHRRINVLEIALALSPTDESLFSRLVLDYCHYFDSTSVANLDRDLVENFKLMQLKAPSFSISESLKDKLKKAAQKVSGL